MGHRSIRFPVELEKRLAALAVDQDRSFSKVVVRVLEQALGEPRPGAARSDRPVGSQAPSGEVPSPAPARVSEPLSPTGEKLKQDYERQLQQAGVRPAREFVKPFRPSPKS